MKLFKVFLIYAMVLIILVSGRSVFAQDSSVLLSKFSVDKVIDTRAGAINKLLTGFSISDPAAINEIRIVLDRGKPESLEFRLAIVKESDRYYAKGEQLRVPIVNNTLQFFLDVRDQALMPHETVSVIGYDAAGQIVTNELKLTL